MGRRVFEAANAFLEHAHRLGNRLVVVVVIVIAFVCAIVLILVGAANTPTWPPV
jgi:integral membrane sensor domain MASE1